MKLFDICLVDDEKIIELRTIYAETAEDAVWEVIQGKELDGVTVIVREWATNREVAHA